MNIDKKALKRYATYAFAILIAILIVGAYFGVHSTEDVKVNSISLDMSKGKIQKIYMNVTYTGSDLAITYFAEDYIANHGKA